MNRLKRIVSGVLVCSILLAGCGKKEEASPSTTNSTSTGTTSAVATEKTMDKPKDEGKQKEKIVTMAVVSPWANLNPLMATSDYDDSMMNLMFEKLVFIKEGGAYAPRLADSWQVADDNLSIVFNLNKNAKWHDGEPVTADDLLFTLKTLANKDLITSRRLFLINVAGTDDSGIELSEGSLAIEKLDEHTVKMDFKFPMDEVIFFFMLRQVYVVPEHLLKDIPVDKLSSHDFWMKPIGCGPLVFQSEVSGERAEFTAFEDYYLGKCDFDRFVLRVVPQTNLLAGLMNGEIDILAGGAVGSLPLSDFAMAKSQKNLIVESHPQSSAQLMMLNNASEHLKDVRVRQAIAMAINKQRIVDELFKGEATVMDSLYAKAHKYYNPEVKKLEYNPEKAKELLAEAGWKPETKLLFMVPTGNLIREQSATMMQQDLAAVGIQVSLQTADLPTVMSSMREGKAELGLIGNGSNGADPNFMITFYQPGSFFDMCRLPDTQYFDLYGKIQEALTEEERLQYTNELQDQIAQNVPYLYLYSPNSLMANNQKISNFNPGDFSSANWDVWNWKVAE